MVLPYLVLRPSTRDCNRYSVSYYKLTEWFLQQQCTITRVIPISRHISKHILLFCTVNERWLNVAWHIQNTYGNTNQGCAVFGSTDSSKCAWFLFVQIILFRTRIQNARDNLDLECWLYYTDINETTMIWTTLKVSSIGFLSKNGWIQCYLKTKHIFLIINT